MARARKAHKASPTKTEQHDPPLAQPDRSGPAIDAQTLFKIAEQRQLFQQADARTSSTSAPISTKSPRISVKKIPVNGQVHDEGSDSSDSDDDDGEVPVLSPTAERALEAMLWTVSLAMLHFTFDVLAQNQYGVAIHWRQICGRAFSAWAVFLLLFYALHARRPDQTLLPGVSPRYQAPLRQLTFFTMSVVSGCYLIYVTNSKGYLATQQRAPPLGCLWIWAVIELELPWATLSLIIATLYLYLNGYNVK